jgi:hypothetical protein
MLTTQHASGNMTTTTTKTMKRKLGTTEEQGLHSKKDLTMEFELAGLENKASQQP